MPGYLFKNTKYKRVNEAMDDLRVFSNWEEELLHTASMKALFGLYVDEHSCQTSDSHKCSTCRKHFERLDKKTCILCLDKQRKRSAKRRRENKSSFANKPKGSTGAQCRSCKRCGLSAADFFTGYKTCRACILVKRRKPKYITQNELVARKIFDYDVFD